MKTSIGIGNYMGDLSIKKEEDKYYWSIENFDGHNWEEIPKKLYDELIDFEKNRLNYKK